MGVVLRSLHSPYRKATPMATTELLSAADFLWIVGLLTTCSIVMGGVFSFVIWVAVRLGLMEVTFDD